MIKSISFGSSTDITTINFLLFDDIFNKPDNRNNEISEIEQELTQLIDTTS